jgi:hypothetical protein
MPLRLANPKNTPLNRIASKARRIEMMGRLPCSARLMPTGQAISISPASNK